MKAVLFDIDGTLLRRTPNRGGVSPKRRALIESFREMFDRDGADYHKLDFEGMTDRQIVSGVAEVVGITPDQLDENWASLDDLLRQNYQTFMDEAGEGEFMALPDARETIEALARAGVKLGLATGNMRWGADIKMAAVGLDGLIEVGGFGDKSSERADIVAEALAELGTASGDSVALVGDTPRDIKAAQANGIEAVGVATGAFNEAQLKENKPTLVLQDLTEHQKLFDLLEI
jgi:phosphoglycolate phosphatase